MNDAHLHMVVNHFPIIGTIFGLGILISGLILKNNSVKIVAYSLFTIAALFTALSMSTGEGAEELVEDMPNIGKQIIHEHEELAEKLALVLYAIGALSLVSIYFSIKKISLLKYTTIVTLLLAVISVFLAQKVGTSGGEIRHTEIRANSNSPIGSQETQGADKD